MRLVPGASSTNGQGCERGVDAAEDPIPALGDVEVGPPGDNLPGSWSRLPLESTFTHRDGEDLSGGVRLKGLEIRNVLVGLRDDGLAAAAGDGEGEMVAAPGSLPEFNEHPGH